MDNGISRVSVKMGFFEETFSNASVPVGYGDKPELVYNERQLFRQNPTADYNCT